MHLTHRAISSNLCLGLCVGLVACTTPDDGGDGTPAASDVEQAVSASVAPIGKGGGTLLSPPDQATPFATTGNGINYNGGPVMTGGTNVYLIWYGSWSGNSAQTIIADWAQNFGESSYYNINTTYDDGAGNHVKNVVNYAGATSDAYSRGTALGDGDIQTIVASAITSGRLPLDGGGVYFVLTSADVNETSGFCTQYCGWHTFGLINGTNIKYSFVGNADRCPSACAGQTTSPNGNAGADAMVSVLSHELEETTSDPHLNAWLDGSGEENADKCAWTFGATYTTPNGASANMRLGNRDYLIQRNWVNASGGFCALGYNPAPPYGANISLTSRADLRYVSADNAGASPLIANRTATGQWETFQLIDLGGGNAAFLSRANGKFVTADNAGASPLIANRTAIGQWETFQWVDLGNGWFALRSAANGRYVTAENSGTSSLIANRTAIGEWEKFHWDHR